MFLELVFQCRHAQFGSDKLLLITRESLMTSSFALITKRLFKGAPHQHTPTPRPNNKEKRNTAANRDCRQQRREQRSPHKAKVNTSDSPPFTEQWRGGRSRRWGLGGRTTFSTVIHLYIYEGRQGHTQCG